ncbi:MAG TPA: FAD-binding oxidoreductase [Ktedonobacterales bacterium]|nr:FAD-binding oxidoreductase [Ktedonobacterales bacterium]
MATIVGGESGAAAREVSGWGLRNVAHAPVVTPNTTDALAQTLTGAAAEGRVVCLRAGGGSYGDAALLDGALTVDSTALDRILAWDAATGIATVEPGVTIERLWRRILPDGWRPTVVPGRSAVTMAGAAAANIHGKNNWRIGSFGDHIESFELATPSGERMTCSRTEHPDLFAAAIGGMGLLGAFTRLKLRTTRVASGLVAERQTAHSSLAALLAAFEAAKETATDLVGWVDTSAHGAALGRGLLGEARDLALGEDPHAAETLRSAWSDWPSGGAKLLRRLPAPLLPTLARPMTRPAGVWLANRAQWTRGARASSASWRRLSYPAANFPLDVIPNWRDTYRPGGLIQHQAFIPMDAALAAFRQILSRAQAAGYTPSLGVLKAQRASDDFLLSYLVDGYSLALDFPVLRGREPGLLTLMRELNDITLDHGGRLYFAKDSTLTPAQVERMYPAGVLDRFAALKRQVDPSETLQSALYRRALWPALRLDAR